MSAALAIPRRMTADEFLAWPEEPEKIVAGPLTLAGIGFTCDVAALCRTTHLAVARPA